MTFKDFVQRYDSITAPILILEHSRFKDCKWLVLKDNVDLYHHRFYNILPLVLNGESVLDLDLPHFKYKIIEALKPHNFDNYEEFNVLPITEDDTLRIPTIIEWLDISKMLKYYHIKYNKNKKKNKYQ